jgi:hypothetical protein
MTIIDKEHYINCLEIERDDCKKAIKKRDLKNTSDVVSWHILCQHIMWLNVHIDMLKKGAYDIKEKK